MTDPAPAPTTEALIASGAPTIVLLDGPHRRYARVVDAPRGRLVVDVGGVQLAATARGGWRRVVPTPRERSR
jgi:carbamate kinase